MFAALCAPAACQHLILSLLISLLVIDSRLFLCHACPAAQPLIFLHLGVSVVAEGWQAFV